MENNIKNADPQVNAEELWKWGKLKLMVGIAIAYNTKHKINEISVNIQN